MEIPLAKRKVSTRKERRSVLWKKRKTINFKIDLQNYDSDNTLLYFTTSFYHEKYRYPYIKNYAKCGCKTFKKW